MSKFLIFGIKKPEDVNMEDLENIKTASLLSIGKTAFQQPVAAKKKKALTTNEISPRGRGK